MVLRVNTKLGCGVCGAYGLHLKALSIASHGAYASAAAWLYHGALYGSYYKPVRSMAQSACNAAFCTQSDHSTACQYFTQPACLLSAFGGTGFTAGAHSRLRTCRRLRSRTSSACLKRSRPMKPRQQRWMRRAARLPCVRAAQLSA